MCTEMNGTTNEAGTAHPTSETRATASVLRQWQRWVHTSAARRATAIVLTAAVLGGGTLTACNASSITGPSSPRPSSQVVGPTGTSLTSNTLTAVVDDSDSDNWTRHEPEKRRRTQEEADADPDYTNTVETTFPVTEAVYNTCRNELVVLNGYLKSRLKTTVGPLGSLSVQLNEHKDTRGVYGEYRYEEEYWDDHDSSWKKRSRVVRYHNKEMLLDQFKVGPAGLPFQSHFNSVMHLQREGPDPFYVKQYGDDLFVHVNEIVKVGTDGVPRVKYEYRTDCR